MPELFDKTEFEFYMRGVYDEEDQRLLTSFRNELDAIKNRGQVDISALVAGKLTGLPGVSDKPNKITKKTMEAYARNYLPDSRLLTDEQYAKSIGFQGIPAYYFLLEPNFMPPMPTGVYFGDYMVVSGHNDTMSYYKPIYEGDEIWTVFDYKDFQDITPLAGSYYRTFAVSGRAKLYNQRGELVAEGENIIKESFRRYKDPAKRSAMRAWESPDWWHQRPHYIYTDADWDFIREVWKNEVSRGPEKLYWDDVNVGDFPCKSIGGPVLLDKVQDIAFHLPQWANEIKQNMFDPEVFKTMVKDEHNLYYPAEHRYKKSTEPVFEMALEGTDEADAMKAHKDDGGHAMPEMPKEVANRDGRSLIQNAVATKWAANMIIRWMGDFGWLSRIGWDIMSNPPGYDPTVLPHHTFKPEMFDKFPYLGRVPGYEDKRADCHGMEYDVCVIGSYVFDKYEKDNEYFVDLAWWVETMDKYIIQEGFATVKLPKK